MRKLFMMALLIACAAPFTFGQTTGDYNKYDVGVLYSHNRVDTGFDDPTTNFFNDREGFNGVEVFVKGNVSRYVGLKGSYSFHRKSFNFSNGTPATTFDTDVDIHQFLGGVEVKDNSPETKVKPFAHALVGVAHNRADITSGAGVSFDETDNGFAAAIGGGVDFRLSDRVDLRAIQFDYNPNRSSGETSHNFRIGIGIIFR